jgi:putative membrane protein
MTGIVEHFALNKAAVWIPYCGAAPAPADLLARWNGDPALLATLSFACAVGLRGGAEKRRFLTATAVLAILFVSPFCALTSAFFSARTIHHLALIAVAAPLFAAAFAPKRVAGGLPLWTGIHAAIFWLWHLPAAYEAALSHDAVYWLMQASLLLSGVALWRGIRHEPLPEGLAALLATTVSMGLLGALLTF